MRRKRKNDGLGTKNRIKITSPMSGMTRAGLLVPRRSCPTLINYKVPSRMDLRIAEVVAHTVQIARRSNKNGTSAHIYVCKKSRKCSQIVCRSHGGPGKEGPPNYLPSQAKLTSPRKYCADRTEVQEKRTSAIIYATNISKVFELVALPVCIATRGEMPLRATRFQGPLPTQG